MKKGMIFLLALHMLFCSAKRQADSVKIVLVSRPESGETIFRANADTCRMDWIAYSSEVNRGVIKQEAECPLSLQAQMPVVRGLLLAVAESEFSSFHTLFYGSLEDSKEMSARLALAARRSALWDMKAGRPVSGSVNDFVVRIANDEGIFPELKEAFATSQRSLKLSSCEKVFVGRADQLPFYEDLRNQGAAPDERLPYGGLVWFSVQVEQDAVH